MLHICTKARPAHHTKPCPDSCVLWEGTVQMSGISNIKRYNSIITYESFKYLEVVLQKDFRSHIELSVPDT
jgi:hypothetical protein